VLQARQAVGLPGHMPQESLVDGTKQALVARRIAVQRPSRQADARQAVK
jgi:hypothetical protein